jgi:hypothetical protein
MKRLISLSIPLFSVLPVPAVSQAQPAALPAPAPPPLPSLLSGQPLRTSRRRH